MNQPTRWRVEPSFTYDLLSVLNVMSGDRYYLAFHRAEYDRLAPRLDAAAHAALAGVKRAIKDKGGQIVSAVLYYLFSGTADRTLDAVLGTTSGCGSSACRPTRRASRERAAGRSYPSSPSRRRDEQG
jgi:hypothetical protein